MSKVPMVATARNNHDGRWLVPGDEFEANSQEEADELRLMGFAQEDKSKRPGHSYVTRDMMAETAHATPDPGPAATAPRGRRDYGRRDTSAR